MTDYLRPDLARRTWRRVLTILGVTGLLVAGNAGVRTTAFVRSYSDNGGDYVVTLHGLRSTLLEMQPMANHLYRCGFTVVNVNYPSNRYPIEALADSIVPALVLRSCPDTTRPVHFVTHSMGGLVVRRMLQHERIRNRAGRVVMVAPPNTGSELASRLRDVGVANRIMGPSLSAFDTVSTSFVNTLGPVDVPTLVIAGRGSYVKALSALIPGDDDGVVAVSRTRVPGMTAHLVVDRSHTFIAMADEVKAAASNFLRQLPPDPRGS